MWISSLTPCLMILEGIWSSDVPKFSHKTLYLENFPGMFDPVHFGFQPGVAASTPAHSPSCSHSSQGQCRRSRGSDVSGPRMAKAPMEPAWVSHASALNMWCFTGFDHDILKSVSQCSASFLGGFSQEIIVKYCQSAPPTQKRQDCLGAASAPQEFVGVAPGRST